MAFEKGKSVYLLIYGKNSPEKKHNKPTTLFASQGKKIGKETDRQTETDFVNHFVPFEFHVMCTRFKKIHKN